MTLLKRAFFVTLVSSLVLASAVSGAPPLSPARNPSESVSFSEGIASETEARRLLETELSNPKYEKTFPREETYLQRLMSAIERFVIDFIDRIMSWVVSLASHTNTAIALAVLIVLGVATLYLVLNALLPRLLERREITRPSTILPSTPYSEEDVRQALASGDIGGAFRIAFVLLAETLRGGVGFHRDTALTNREIAYATARILPDYRDPLIFAARTADCWFYAESPPSRLEGERACLSLLDALSLLRRPEGNDAGGPP
jgi:hypothetical protein